MLNQRKGIKILVLLSLMFTISCNNDVNKTKRLAGGEFDREGFFIKDSLLDGEIKYYTTGTDNLVAIKHFKEGVLEGQATNYYNGKIIQTINFEGGLENGYANLYDSATGFLEQRRFYFHGKQLGSSFQYNSSGSVTDFMFKNFENKELFYSYLDSSNNFIHEDYEKLITINVERITNNNEEKLRLFSYLIYPPMLSIEYKVVYFDQKESPIDSIVLPKTDIIFWEGYIDYPTPNKKPAFILNIYDSSTKRSQTLLNYIALKED